MFHFCFEFFKIFWDDIDLYCNHVDEHIDSLGVTDRDQRNQLCCGWQGIEFFQN